MMPQRRRLLAAGIVAAAGAAFGAGVRAQPKERVIKVVARKFVWLPNVITLKKGEPVVLEFTAPELKQRVDIIPGQVATLRMLPDRVGSFDFLCDIFCGEGHEGMSGKIHVVA